jgi:hypothetical protein
MRTGWLAMPSQFDNGLNARFGSQATECSRRLLVRFSPEADSRNAAKSRRFSQEVAMAMKDDEAVN